MSWDKFLPETANREAVERFRSTPWVNIRRELVDRFSVAEATHHEPLWTAPGEAMYWQLQATTHIVDIPKEDQREGRKKLRWEEDPAKWLAVGPLSSMNAAQIAGYLKRGLRLRPPGSDAESVDEVSETAEATGDSTGTFTCRHGTSQYAFRSWKAYLRHCSHFNEIPKHEVPSDVVAHAKTFRWFCFVHNIGWGPKQERGMKQHMKTAKLRTAMHPAILETAPPLQEAINVPV
jgi:hypothetical protein